MIFNKYEFENEAQWLAAKQTLYITEIIDEEEVTYLRPEINSIVELGFICFDYEQDEDGNLTCSDLSSKYAIDVLLNSTLSTLDAYIVTPDPSSIKHTFGGLQGSYLESFCEAHPNSTHCIISTT
tara:strand:+ start:2126 stop:2500 length:375 start_codon:yes stop_codon:yes gene_type:complete